MGCSTPGGADPAAPLQQVVVVVAAAAAVAVVNDDEGTFSERGGPFLLREKGPDAVPPPARG